MKRTLALILAAIMLAAALAGCATALQTTAAISAGIRTTSSDTTDAATQSGTLVVLGQYYDGSTIFGNTWITSELTPDGYEPIRINPSTKSTITVGVNTAR